MMRTGIPEHRLPKGILQRDIDDILAQGVELRLNSPVVDPTELLKVKGGMKSEWIQKLRCGVILEGVDLWSGSAGLTSCVHTDEDIERTAAAFRTAIRQMKKEGSA